MNQPNFSLFPHTDHLNLPSSSCMYTAVSWPAPQCLRSLLFLCQTLLAIVIPLGLLQQLLCSGALCGIHPLSFDQSGPVFFWGNFSLFFFLNPFLIVFWESNQSQFKKWSWDDTWLELPWLAWFNTWCFWSKEKQSPDFLWNYRERCCLTCLHSPKRLCSTTCRRQWASEAVQWQRTPLPGQGTQETRIWFLAGDDPLKDHTLQDSCLENPRDRGACWVTVHGVAKSQTRLSNWALTYAHRV